MFNYSALLMPLASKLARISGKVMEKPLEVKGISLQEFKITGLLIGEDNINQKQLAQMLSVKPATLSVAISKLEKKGVLARTVSETDKRVNTLSLSEDLDLNDMNDFLLSIETTMLQGLSDNDIDVTRRSLHTMIQNLENVLDQE